MLLGKVNDISHRNLIACGFYDCFRPVFPKRTAKLDTVYAVCIQLLSRKTSCLKIRYADELRRIVMDAYPILVGYEFPHQDISKSH